MKRIVLLAFAGLMLSSVCFAADKDKDDEEGTIAGLPIQRSQGGWLGLELKDSTFRVTFYNAKKKPIPADASSIAMRWTVHYQPNDERTLLVPSGRPSRDDLSLLCQTSPYFSAAHRPPL